MIWYSFLHFAFYKIMAWPNTEYTINIHFLLFAFCTLHFSFLHEFCFYCFYYIVFELRLDVQLYKWYGIRTVMYNVHSTTPPTKRKETAAIDAAPCRRPHTVWWYRICWDYPGTLWCASLIVSPVLESWVFFGADEQSSKSSKPARKHGGLSG